MKQMTPYEHLQHLADKLKSARSDLAYARRDVERYTAAVADCERALAEQRKKLDAELDKLSGASK